MDGLGSWWNSRGGEVMNLEEGEMLLPFATRRFVCVRLKPARRTTTDELYTLPANCR